jgi:hypothetical protein
MNNCFLIILIFILYVNQFCDGVPLITKNNLMFLLNNQWHPVAQQLPKYNVMIHYEACVNKYFFKYTSYQIFPPNNLGGHIVLGWYSETGFHIDMDRNFVFLMLQTQLQKSSFWSLQRSILFVYWARTIARISVDAKTTCRFNTFHSLFPFCSRLNSIE